MSPDVSVVESSNSASTQKPNDDAGLFSPASLLGLRARDVARLSPAQLNTALRQSLHFAERSERSAILCLAEMKRRRAYVELGYATLQQYAQEGLGFSPGRTRCFLHLAETLQRLPMLRAALDEDDIGWTLLREVVKVATPASDEQWSRLVRTSSRRKLVALVARVRARRRARRETDPLQATLATTAKPGPVGVGVGVGSHLPPVTDADPHQPRPRAASPTPASDARPQVFGVESSFPPLPGEAPSAASAPAPPACDHPEEVDEAALIDQLAIDAPATLTLRFDALQCARFEALIEWLYKAGLVPRNATLEDVILAALEEWQTASRAGADPAASSPPAADPAAAGPEAADPASDPPQASARPRAPRGALPSPYRVIVYQADAVSGGIVQTMAGPRQISQEQMEVILCDAVISAPGEKNRATLPPSTRIEVFRRDRGRCRVCGRPHFLNLHHLVARELGGSNQAGNLVLLCSHCHRLVHAGKIDMLRFLRTGSGAPGRRDPGLTADRKRGKQRGDATL